MRLSYMERRVGELLLSGNLPIQIAQELEISTGMVKGHLHRMYAQAQIDGRKFNKLIRLVYLLHIQFEEEKRCSVTN